MYAFSSRRIRLTSLHEMFLKLAITQRRLFLRFRECLANIDPASRRLDDVLSLRRCTTPAFSTHTLIVPFFSRPSRCYGFRAPFVVPALPHLPVPASSRLLNNLRLFLLTIVECFVTTHQTELLLYIHACLNVITRVTHDRWTDSPTVAALDAARRRSYVNR